MAYPEGSWFDIPAENDHRAVMQKLLSSRSYNRNVDKAHV